MGHLGKGEPRFRHKKHRVVPEAAFTAWGLQALRLGLGMEAEIGKLLQRLPFSEQQLCVSSLIAPNLQETQQALFTALLHLGQVRGLRIAVINLQTQQQRDSLQTLHVDLIAGPLIGTPAEAPADLLITNDALFAEIP